MEIPGEKLIIKLWDTIADKGIGNLLRPWQMRREGRAAIEIRREEMLALAQAESDASQIRSGRKLLSVTGELIERPALPTPAGGQSAALEAPLLSLPLAIEVADANSKADAVRKEVSISKAVIYAEQELESDGSEPSTEKPEDDWLLRWRECAAGVSSDELQQIWGKVLAGEVKSPGKFSLRTLEFLRNLSQADARAIEKISPFVVSGVVYSGDGNVLESEGITFSNLLAMQELGVLGGVDALGLQMQWESNEATTFQKVLTSHGRVILVSSADVSKVLTLKICTVTAIGKQVLSLGKFAPNEKMIESLARFIKSQGFDVQIGSYLQINEDQILPINLQPI